MTPAEWLAEVARRIGIDEGVRTRVYEDTATPPNPTIGIGYNLNRPDAAAMIEKIGANYERVRAGLDDLTPDQVQQLFALSFAPIVSQARASLDVGVFDAMTDARRFVICDLVYNLGDGPDGWPSFVGTRALLCEAQHLKNIGQLVQAHTLFAAAAGPEHLAGTPWYSQTGDRAKRDVAMLLTGDWVSATGDGSY